jgi:Trk K+ transport system NAD-binding subunit
MHFFRRLRARARYFLDRAFDREFAAQLGLFVLLVFFVALIGMTAIFFGLFAPQNAQVEAIPRGLDQGVLDAFWWSINHVLSLPEFERMYGASGVVLLYSFLLSVVGIAVFGILISLINNSMRNRVDALRRGDTPVLEKNHVLILGWSGVTIAVLRQLAQLRPGIRVVILAPLDIDEMREKLRIAGIPLLRITVILRSGVTSNQGELKRVAVLRASSIIVLATRVDDSLSIKTLVQLAALDWPAEPPTITVEIKEEMSREIAQIASRNRAHIVTSSSLISRVIVQTVRNPGLSGVISELGSTSGNNICVQLVPQSVGKTIEEIAHHFPAAVPIGVSWKKNTDDGLSHAVALNPEPDYDLAEDDRLVFLAREQPVQYVARPFQSPDNIHEAAPKVPSVPERILLIGSSDIIDDILLQIDDHASRGTQITVLAERPVAEIEEQIRNAQTAPFHNIATTIVQGDTASASPYSRLKLAEFDCIVVLASSVAGVDSDTQTLRVLLRISDIRTYDKSRAHTVVELTEETNRDIFQNLGVDDIVVSTDIVSVSLAQVSQEPVMGPIYRELLNVGGVEISLRPLVEYMQADSEFVFDDLVYAAQQKLEIALGVRWGGTGSIDLNPDRNTRRVATDSDRVVVLAQQIYH